MARLLQLDLMENPKVKKRVFIDSDDLRDLDMLFEYVSKDTDTMIGLCSKLLLHRPWCVGELANAHQASIHTVRVVLPDFEDPKPDFISGYCDIVPDTEKLAEHGVTPGMMSAALAWFQEQQSVHLQVAPSEESLAMTLFELVQSQGSLKRTTMLSPVASRQQSTTRGCVVS